MSSGAPQQTQSSAEHAALAASRVLMVRPACFGWNPQTQASNRFQRDDAAFARNANERACMEFDALAAALRGAGVDVRIATDRAEPICPDAVFPNNWVSLHEDGTVVLYPMLARNRRLERRLDIIATLAAGCGLAVRRLLEGDYPELRVLATRELLPGVGEAPELEIALHVEHSHA